MNQLKTYTIICIFLFLSEGMYAQIASCEDCDKRLLTNKDIVDKSKEELSLFCNEIYARKGYRFEKGLFGRYFNSQKWYKPLRQDEGLTLSEIETKNVDFLKRAENDIQRKRDLVIRDLKQFKMAVNQNDKSTLRRFAPPADREDAQSFDVHIRAILNKVDLDDIHWNKKYGFYEVIVDNGFSKTSYSIRFMKDTVELSISDPFAHSENFGDFFDGYSDYMSEEESTFCYIYKITDTGIKFQNLWVAG